MYSEAAGSSQAPVKVWAALILLAMIGLSTTFAWAQDGSSIKAKALFDKGLVQYRISEFKKALVHFEAALKLANRPSIILNVAQCHRQLGNTKKALFFYKLYLTTWDRENPGKTSPYAAEIQKFIKNLAADVASFKQGTLVISSTPPGAEIWVDGKLRPGSTPIKLTGISAGDHVIELRKGDLRHRGTVRVEGLSTTRIAATLKEVFGSVAVSSKPPGAEINLDGRLVGRTPRTLQRLPLGRHTIELRMPHHAPARREVQISDDAARKVSLKLDPMGIISVKSEPIGASVYIDDKRVGPSPITQEVLPGRHKVKLVMRQRQPITRHPTVSPGKTVALAVELELLPEIQDRLSTRRLKRVFAWISMPLGIAGSIAGAAMIGFGVTEGSDAIDSYKLQSVQRDMDEHFDQAEAMRQLEIAGWVTASVSVALIATSIYLFATIPDMPAEERNLSLSVEPLNGGAAMSLGGVF